MCKALTYSSYLLLCLFLWPNVIWSQDLINPRQTGIEQAVQEELYHVALSASNDIDDILEDILGNDTKTRAVIIGLIETRYPEWAYKVGLTDRNFRKDKIILNKIKEIIRDESTMGLFSSEKEMLEFGNKMGISDKEIASLAFFKGYEEFKRRDYIAAEKTFSRVIAARSDEFDYALYYAGLTSMLTGNLESAKTRLGRIRGPKKILDQTPYYLAAIHYAHKEYNLVTGRYESRLKERDLFHKADLRQIIALSYIQQKNWQKAVEHLEILNPREKELRLLTAIAYSELNRYDKATAIFQELSKKKNEFGSDARFEYALATAQWGNTGLAIELFDELNRQNTPYQVEATWNLALLTARAGDYQRSADYASHLMNSSMSDLAKNHLRDMLEALKSDDLAFEAAVLKLRDGDGDATLASKAIYEKALDALSQTHIDKAKKYFDMLNAIDANGSYARMAEGWRGIIAYKAGHFPEAQRRLTAYLSNTDIATDKTKLTFDAHYFLGYTCFKLKQHNRSLGYFAQAREMLPKVLTPKSNWDVSVLEEDLLVRMGDVYLLLNDYEAAEKSYDLAGKQKKYQGDYILFQRGVIAGLRDRPYDKILFLDQIEEEYAQSKYSERAKYEKAGTLFSLAKYERAAAEYADLVERTKSTEMRELCMLQLGLINSNKGNFAEAENQYTRIVGQSKNTAMVRAAKRALREIYTEHTYDTDSYLELVESDVKAKSGSFSRDSVLYALSLKNIDDRNFSIAFEQLGQLASDYPQSPYYKAALWRQAEILNQLGRLLPSAEKYAEVMALTPTGEDDFDEMCQAYTDIVFVTLKDYKRYTQFALKYATVLEDKYMMNGVLASLFTNSYSPEDEARLLTLLGSADLSVGEKVNLLDLGTKHYMMSQNWTAVTTLLAASTGLHIVNASPRLIYFDALAKTNSGSYEASSTSITSRYEVLKKDAAWLAKSIILLSDNYIIQGEINAALAALEALDSSQNKLPASLQDIVSNRLENLRIHIKYIQSQKQHGDE